MAEPTSEVPRSPGAPARWRVAAMAVLGFAVCVLLGFIFLSVTASEEQGLVRPGPAFLAFLILTPVVLVPAFVLWSYGKRSLPGIALGLAIGWAASAVAAGGMGVARFIAGHGPAAVTAFDARTGQEVWDVRLEGAHGVGTPTTWAGLVLVQTGRSSGSTAGTLMALDTRTGRKVWEAASNAAPASCGGAAPFGLPPVLADGVAVVRARDGAIRALDARTGQERWRARAEGAPAAATGGVVVIGAATGYTGLNLTTGAQLWTRTMAEAAFRDDMPGEHATTLGSGSVFLVETTVPETASFEIEALDARTGRPLWQAPVGSVDSTGSRYDVDGTNTFLALEGGPAGPDSQEHHIGARDLRTGQQLWAGPTLPLNDAQLPWTSLAAAGGHTFYASSAAGLVAVDSRSADRDWAAPLPPTHEDLASQPTLAADQDVVAVGQHERLTAFDPATGARRWTTPLDFGADGSQPAVGEGLVLMPRSTSSCS
jgi:outer membrane protein assembly factor BamB